MKNCLHLKFNNKLTSRNKKKFYLIKQINKSHTHTNVVYSNYTMKIYLKEFNFTFINLSTCFD